MQDEVCDCFVNASWFTRGCSKSCVARIMYINNSNIKDINQDLGIVKNSYEPYDLEKNILESCFIVAYWLLSG